MNQIKIENWNGHEIRFVNFELHEDLIKDFADMGILYIDQMPVYVARKKNSVITGLMDWKDILNLAINSQDEATTYCFLKLAETLHPSNVANKTHKAPESMPEIEKDDAPRDINYTERDLQNDINDNPEKYFGKNSKIIDKEFDIEGKKADFLIEVNDVLAIVECKIGKIDRAALYQLLAYMYLSGINKGVLVGISCDIKLPKNITFISYK
jgi:hypothetical protein